MPRLVPLAGPNKGRAFELSEGDLIGRSEPCVVRLRHASVSRVHARLDREGDDWVLVDAESRNGIYLRAERVERVTLEDGVRLKLGDYPVRFELDEGGGQAAEEDEVLDEDLEFLDELDAPATQTEVRPRADAVSGLTLEDPADIELSAARPAERPRAAPARSSSVDRQAELVRELEAARRGLLRGDLTQQPAWVQAAVWVGVIGFGLGLAALAVVLVRGAA